MTLADIAPHNRSSIEQMQLVLLCQEKDYQHFGQEEVFSNVKRIADLKKTNIIYFSLSKKES